VGVVIATAVVLMSIFGAAFTQQLTDEFKAWTPWIVERLIQRAVRRLPIEMRERLDEEWRAHIDEIPGQIGQLLVAFGFVIASRKITLHIQIVRRLATASIVRKLVPAWTRYYAVVALARAVYGFLIVTFPIARFFDPFFERQINDFLKRYDFDRPAWLGKPVDDRALGKVREEFQKLLERAAATKALLPRLPRKNSSDPK
jgi:hypothetical protein